MLPGLATSTSGSNMVVSVFQDPVPSSLMPGMAVQTDVGMEREVAGQMMSTGSQVKWFFTEYLLEFFFLLFHHSFSFSLVLRNGNWTEWNAVWSEIILVIWGQKLQSCHTMASLSFVFLQVDWLPLANLGRWLVVLSSAPHCCYFIGLRKGDDLEPKKIERFVIKKICSTDSQSDCKGRWWFETRCSKFRNHSWLN